MATQTRALRRRRLLSVFCVPMVLAALAVAGPTAPAQAGAAVYPQLGQRLSSAGVAVATAGIVDLTSPMMPPQPAAATPSEVVGAAGSRPLQAAPILRAGVDGSPLAQVSLVSLRLQDLPVSLPLSTMPLAPPRTWRDVLAGTPLAGVPLVNVTWAQVLGLATRPASVNALTVADVDWSGSILRDLPLAAFTYGGTPITAIDIPPLSGRPANASPAQKWCELLNSVQANSCTSATSLQGKTLIEVGVDGAPVRDLPLQALPLKSIDRTAAPLKSIPLKSIVMQTAPLKSIPLKSIDLTAAPLKSIPLKSIDWATAPLKSIPLKSIDLTAAPLKSIPLGSVANAAAIAGCASAGTCPAGATLGSVAAAGDLLPGATLEDVGTQGFDTGNYELGGLGYYVTEDGHDVTLGDLGTWALPTGEISLGDLAPYLDSSVSLSDVLAALVPAASFPFENFSFDNLRLSRLGRAQVAPINEGGSATQWATVGSRPELATRIVIENPSAQATASTDFKVTLPRGASFVGLKLMPELSYDQTLPKQLTADGRVQIVLRDQVVPPNPADPNDRPTLDLLWAPGGSLDEAPKLDVAVLDHGTGAAQSSRTYSLPPISDGQEPNTPTEFIRDYAANPMDPDRRIPDMPVSWYGSPNTDLIASGHISYSGDVDWFRVKNVTAGSRISADLTNLPVDADLVLYGPPGSVAGPSMMPRSAIGLPGQLVEDPDLAVGQAARALATQGLDDLYLDQGYNVASGSAQPRTPLSISQHRGTDPEAVGAIAPVDGDYVVQVSGYTTTRSDLPYTLRIRAAQPTQAMNCVPRSFPHPMPAAGATPTVGSGVNTVFLTAPARLSATYGQVAADQVATALQSAVAWMGSHPGRGLVPAVVPVDSYPAVRAAYDAWDAAPCDVSAANKVAAEISRLLKGFRANGTDLDYVTIVGGDDLVPMGRVPDLTRVGNESEYASTFEGGDNPVSAAAAGSWIMTDDAYGDPSPTPVGNGNDLFVPQISVGRVVESPADIAAQLASFRTNGGRLDTSTGLVSGYDFLSDGATAAAGRLAAGTGRRVDSSLVDSPGETPGWTGADLLAAMFPGGDASPLVQSVNAHYDHHALLSARGEATGGQDLVTGDEVAAAAGAARLAGRVLFTMGCHAGLTVPDAYVAGTGAAATSDDWAQTLAKANVAVYVANTGFGIGDSQSVAYSERLMALYAKLLNGSMSAGQALTYAKQAYYGSLGTVGVYDLKILQEAAFYGLPFWQIDVPTPAATPTRPALPGQLKPVAGTPLQSMSVGVSPDFTRVDTGRGTFWTADAQDPQVTQFQPVQPRSEVAVGTNGPTAHGALITSLTSHDITDVTPVLSVPTVDSDEASPSPRAEEAAWPASVAQVTTSQAPYGRAQNLVVMPGQFVGSTHDGSGTQRLYDEVGVEVFYAPAANTDFSAPSITGVTKTLSGNQLTFAAAVTDSDSETIHRVRVGYQTQDGVWHFTELAAGSGSAWSGSVPSGAGILRFFVQAVDGSGNVATSAGKGNGFVANTPVVPPTDPPPTDPPPPPPPLHDSDATAPEITARITPAPNAAGWVAGTEATVTFTCSDAGSGLAAGACPAPVVVTAQGSTPVARAVTDLAGNIATATVGVNLDGTPPTVSTTGSGKAAHCVTTDLVSGVATPASSRITPGKTKGLATTMLTCGVATDRAGNASTALTTTSVDAISMSRFAKPVAGPPRVNKLRPHQQVRLVFRLKQGKQRLTTTGAVLGIDYRVVKGKRWTTTPRDKWRKAKPAKRGKLRYDAELKSYRFVWQPPRAKGFLEVRLRLADGAERTARFQIR